MTIAYDGQARVHVTAIDVTGGREATTEIIRPENVVTTEVEGATEEESPSEIQEPATSVDDCQVEKWANSTDRVAVQLPDDDDEILDLSKPSSSTGTDPGGRKRVRRKKSKTRTPSGNKSGRSQPVKKRKTAGGRQTVKPPPLPPGLDSSQDSASAEEEFWNLPDS